MVLICPFYHFDFLRLNSDVWFTRNSDALQVVLRVVFGVFWLIDGALKFQPGFVDAFSGMISGAAAGQPSWLSG
jgi:uncharacterized membrane protein YphA (DoxX/SURF4 family)